MRYSLLGIGTAVFTAVLPFVVFPELFYSAVNSKYFFAIAAIDVLALIVAYTLYKKHHTFFWRQRWFLATLAVLLVVQYAASYLGVFFEKSLWSDILRSTGVLFFTHIGVLALLLSEFLRKEDWTLLRRATALSAAVFGLLTLLGTDGLGVENILFWVNLGDDGLSIGNSTFAGVYLLIAFFLGLIELTRSSGEVKWRRILLGSLTLIAFSPVMINISLLFGTVAFEDLLSNPMLFLGTARASSATMLLLLAFFAGRWGINRFLSEQYLKQMMFGWSGLLLLATAAGVGFLFVPGSAVQEAYIESSTSARIMIWDAGIAAFKERPILGWGPENFNDAFERHFDNRLFLDENIGEVWFDRAHNIIVDTLVSLGLVGAAALVLVGLVFVWTAYRAFRAGLIGSTEALIVGAFVPAHFLQLQTGFDTVASYGLLSVMVGYVLYLERGVAASLPPLHTTYNTYLRYAIAGLLVALALVSLKFAFYDEYVRQGALVKTFVTTSHEEQIRLIRISLSQSSDWESLRLSNASFIKGVVAGASEASDPQVYAANALKTARVYEELFKKYLEKHPDYYRARMNYAYLLVIETALGNGPKSLVTARDILKNSYALSPNHPLTYGLSSLVFLYGLNFDKALERANAGIALNPELEFSRGIKAYVEEQIARFPKKNKLLNLENL